MQSEGFLTTHVLDTSTGVPASGLRVLLSRLVDGGWEPVTAVNTNDDGRCDKPLLGNGAMVAGDYELLFYYEEYLRRSNSGARGPLFLDQIPVRFSVTDTTRHYHVPLLVSPYGYSTYRGS